jgi:hypothetical protein
MNRKTGFDELENADRLRVLGIIDQFRTLGISEDISLPQVSIDESAMHPPANTATKSLLS